MYFYDLGMLVTSSQILYYLVKSCDPSKLCRSHSLFNVNNSLFGEIHMIFSFISTSSWRVALAGYLEIIIYFGWKTWSLSFNLHPPCWEMGIQKRHIFFFTNNAFFPYDSMVWDIRLMMIFWGFFCSCELNPHRSSWVDEGCSR